MGLTCGMSLAVKCMCDYGARVWYQGRHPRVAAEGKLGQVLMGFWCCHLQSVEIMNLVELIGLGEGNKTSLGRLKNDVKRSVRKTLSAKTRDVLKDVEPRLTVCLFRVVATGSICTLAGRGVVCMSTA